MFVAFFVRTLHVYLLVDLGPPESCACAGKASSRWCKADGGTAHADDCLMVTSCKQGVCIHAGRTPFGRVVICGRDGRRPACPANGLLLVLVKRDWLHFVVAFCTSHQSRNASFPRVATRTGVDADTCLQDWVSAGLLLLSSIIWWGLAHTFLRSSSLTPPPAFTPVDTPSRVYLLPPSSHI